MQNDYDWLVGVVWYRDEEWDAFPITDFHAPSGTPMLEVLEENLAKVPWQMQGKITWARCGDTRLRQTDRRERVTIPVETGGELLYVALPDRGSNG